VLFGKNRKERAAMCPRPLCTEAHQSSGNGFSQNVIQRFLACFMPGSAPDLLNQNLDLEPGREPIFPGPRSEKQTRRLISHWALTSL
jgi:hypothetical protein